MSIIKPVANFDASTAGGKLAKGRHVREIKDFLNRTNQTVIDTGAGDDSHPIKPWFRLVRLTGMQMWQNVSTMPLTSKEKWGEVILRADGTLVNPISSDDDLLESGTLTNNPLRALPAGHTFAFPVLDEEGDIVWIRLPSQGSPPSRILYAMGYGVYLAEKGRYPDNWNPAAPLDLSTFLYSSDPIDRIIVVNEAESAPWETNWIPPGTCLLPWPAERGATDPLGRPIYHTNRPQVITNLRLNSSETWLQKTYLNKPKALITDDADWINEIQVGDCEEEVEAEEE